MLCPRLSTLFFYVNSRSDPKEVEWLKAMVGMLIARSHSGRPLRFLSIMPVSIMEAAKGEALLLRLKHADSTHDLFRRELEDLVQAQHLTDFELVAPKSKNWMLPDIGDKWKVEGEEEYWDLSGVDRTQCLPAWHPKFRIACLPWWD